MDSLRGLFIPLIFLLTPQISFAQIIPTIYSTSWIEGACDSQTSTFHGATRTYYNREQRLSWDNSMGDWLDAKMTHQGLTPFSTIHLENSNLGTKHKVDLTSLTNLWLNQELENHGLFMVHNSGEYFKFFSKDNDNINIQPRLTVVTSEDTYILYPYSDTDLQKTTYTCRGEDAFLVGKNNILITFNLSGIRGELITSELALYSGKNIYGYANADIYAAKLPHSTYTPVTPNKSQSPLLTWVEGVCDSSTSTYEGATRDYFQRSIKAQWEHKMGDWLDADLINQGNTPFSTIQLGAESLNSTQQIDITNLVNSWLDGTFDNHGVLIKKTDGEYVSFHSKENPNERYQPKLLIMTNSGNYEIFVDSDTDLQQSTYTCRGQNKTLVANNNILLRFDFSHINEKIISAKLQLTTSKATYQFVELAVFAATIPREKEQEQEIDTLAEAKIDNYIPLELEVTESSPVISFTDLISGPSVGIDDGLGSGVIVTMWGFNLGSSQGDSYIEYCDNSNSCLPVAHIYYWKNADGTLPGGPSNLYSSHGMQEVSFSIPVSTSGNGEIKVTTLHGAAATPFTVRDGSIYHVMPSGNDDTGDGSYQNPWRTIDKADSTINAGSTLYVHDITAGDENTTTAIYNNRTEAMSTLSAQFSYVAYPNTRPEAIGERGFNQYSNGDDLTSGFVISKFSFFTAEADEDENNQPTNIRGNVTYGIMGSRDGRAVGNYLTDKHPSDVTGACPDGQQAAIVASAQSSDRVSNFKIFGNHIFDYGCEGSTKFQHTTYITVRSGDQNRQLEAPEMGWNFLQDNKTSGGLHYFDENLKGENCGQFITPLNIHDNVIVNQAGPALAYGSNCPVDTTVNFYNNVAINAGLKADFDDETINGSLNNAVSISIGHVQVTSQINFDNNVFYRWNSDNQLTNLRSCLGLSSRFSNALINWNSNICYTEQDLHFIRSNYLGDALENKISGRNNLWYTTAKTPINAIPPSWDNNPFTVNPLITVTKNKISLTTESPLRDLSESSLLRGVYGAKRGKFSSIGAVESVQE
jgi:hypothetical protein